MSREDDSRITRNGQNLIDNGYMGFEQREVFDTVMLWPNVPFDAGQWLQALEEGFLIDLQECSCLPCWT